MDQGFLDEAAENATAFASGMVELEQVTDAEVSGIVNELFRRAHNLKGMAAMEDQGELAQLAHAAEDVLSRYREAGGRPPAVEVDALLAAADGMEAMVQALAGGGEPAPADEIRTRLRTFVGGDAPAPVATERAAITWDDDVVSGYRVALVEGTPAPKARARLVLRAAGELADVAGTDPPELEGIDAANLSFVIGLRAGADETALVARLDRFREVASVEPVDLPRVAAAPEPAAPEPSAPATTTVRVEVARLDQLLDLVGELVVEKNRLLARAAGVDDRAVHESAAALADVVGELRDVVGRVRMVNLEATFTRMQRVARDVAREVGKDVDLELHGASTSLDRSVVDEVLQPLVHLVRNAIDHGIEPSAEARVDAGKPARGRVDLRAEQRGPEVVIEVSDDGGGIDTARLAAKAVEKGLVAPEAVEGLDPTQVYDLMFLPGFTSRADVGLVSGRGVGLDVVRGKVEGLGGSIAVSSTLGEGTTFALHFPLSLVVLDALLVDVTGEVWALPVTRCEETVRLPATGVGSTYEHRDVSLPVIDGAQALGRVTSGDAPEFGVILREGGGRYLLTVHDLVGRSEVVIKPAPRGVPGTEHIAGLTVLAEGQVALVPDLALIVRRARRAGDVAAVVSAEVDR